MFIKRLKMTNFRNFQELTLDFVNGINEISKDNGWGKTNVADAIAWVLTNKLHDGSSAIETIKPKEDSKLLVEVSIEFDDGNMFKKTYQEDWVKSRDSGKLELKGNLQRNFFNDQELKLNEFKTKIADRLGVAEELFQVLSIPTFFGNNLHWSDRKKIITQIVGEPTFEEVKGLKIFDNLNPKLLISLEHDLLTYGKSSDVSKIYKSKIKDLKKGAEQKEILIADYEKDTIDIGYEEFEAIKKELDSARKELYKLEQAPNIQEELANKQKEIELLRTKWKAIQASAFIEKEPSISVCPHCGKALDEEYSKSLIKAYNERKDSFEKSKSSQLEQINERGKKLKVEIEELTNLDQVDNSKQIADLKATIAKDEILVTNYEVFRQNNIKRDNLITELHAESIDLGHYLELNDALDIYITASLSLLNERVMSVFGDEVSFRFISENIKTDSFDEVCDLMDNKVPYLETNTASQIQLGLKIIKVIGEKLDYKPLPIIIDNAEAVVDHSTLISNGQIICLNAKGENRVKEN